MFPVSIIQGRLSPDLRKRFQFFPDEWEKEFPRARQLGFAGIEWLIDADKWRENPVFSDQFKSAADGNFGVPVASVAADWFMAERIWEGEMANHRAALSRVIDAAALTVNRLVLIPLLEKNTVVELAVQRLVQEAIRPLVSKLEGSGVRIAFETELPAHNLAQFVDGFGSDTVGVYFDTGNCTSYGFDCPADIHYLAHRVMGVHVKDRSIGSTQNVPLGTGDTDFEGIIKALSNIGWQGHLVMQAWRGDHYIQDAEQQLRYIEQVQTHIFT